MNDTSLSKKQFRFTGFHMALCMVAFFGTIIAVNVFMATLASTSWTGLVVKNSYVASQKFNGELEAARVQQARGWVSQLKYDNGILQLNLWDRNGNAVKLIGPTVFIGRPAFEQQDQNLQFSAVKQGSHTLPLRLDIGLWDLRITGSIDGKPYRRDARILVDGSRSGKLQ